VWDFVRTFLGDITESELLLVGIIFLCVLGFSWAPRLGEALSGVFVRVPPSQPGPGASRTGDEDTAPREP
jgi:hypothetical protein